jgi:hypothetical protein
MRSTTRRAATTVRLIGGPTLVIGVGGLRLLTDPAAGRPRPDGGELRITGVPAQPEPGEVTGFVLSGVDTPTIYLSGGNVSPDVAEEVAQRCAPIDVAVLSAGAPEPEALSGDQAAAILGSPTVLLA